MSATILVRGLLFSKCVVCGQAVTSRDIAVTLVDSCDGVRGAASGQEGEGLAGQIEQAQEAHRARR